MLPTAFQYSNGWPMRFEISVSPMLPGQTRAARAYAVAAVAASTMPLMATWPQRGASLAPVTPAAKTARYASVRPASM